jgi:catechol 2,3-dioxygenase-like lactoylglutathione lyase family enzyme
MMGVTRLNHAVLYVSDLDRSVAFYRDVLDFRPVNEIAPGLRAAFLQAPDSTNDHDLGLFEVGAGAATPTSTQAQAQAQARGTVGLYHLAWEVDTLATLERTAARLTAAQALVGATDHGTTKSLYARDPDGIEFEVVWLIPASLLDDEALAARSRLRPLDLAAAKRRYGADTRGGVGISVPA